MIVVSFKAGIMKEDPSTGSVVADNRKGWVIVTKEEDDLVRLYWLERSDATAPQAASSLADSAEECLVLFPEDAEFKHLKDKPGRIFLLKFLTSSKRLFFWMQEPSSVNDDLFCKNINDLISGFAADTAADQVMTDATATATTASSSQAKSIIPPGFLDQYLNGAEARSSSSQRKGFMQLLNVQSLAEFVKKNPDVHDRLKAHLPAEILDFSENELEKTVRSPFFQQVSVSLLHTVCQVKVFQALRVLDSALDNGHLPSLLVQFGIPVDETLLHQFNAKSGSEIFLLSLLRLSKQ